MKKILFLDIDGVLNSIDNMNSLYVIHNLIDRNQKTRDQYGHLFDERCVRYLKWIVHETKCKIVITSTWRKDGLLKLQNMWSGRNLPGVIIDVTPNTVDQRIINMYGAVEDNADRGFEIQQWLEENNWDRYCIVDDDSDMLSHQMEHLVNTDSRIGLNLDTADKIIKILNE